MACRSLRGMGIFQHPYGDFLFEQKPEIRIKSTYLFSTNTINTFTVQLEEQETKINLSELNLSVIFP